jgi:hypothetical protein
VVGRGASSRVRSAVGTRKRSAGRARISTNDWRMALPKTVRRTRKGVSRGNRGRAAAPQSRSIPGATYWLTVSILGYPVRIFRIPGFQEEGQLGACYGETLEIYLKSPLSSTTEEADTLLHEVVHAISRVGLPPSARLNEEQVTLLSTILTDTLKRNPKLREILTARLEEA